MNVPYNNKTIRICIDINIESSKVDLYAWIFTSRIFRLALEITFLLNKYLFLQIVYELLSQSRKPNKRVGEGPGNSREAGNFFEKSKGRGETFIRDPRVLY